MSHTAELIAVGTELLLGNIANTDAQMLSQGLSALGINVYYHTVVGDNPQRLRAAVELARTRADIIITTGGLGPTCDDLTKNVLAECFGKKLVFHEPSARRIEAYFQRLHAGRPMTENNYQQAMLPEGCTVLDNDWGTAPGVAFEAGGVRVIMLPGPPRECKAMFTHRVVPYLKSLADGVIVSRTLKLFGIGESSMEAQLRDEMNAMTNPTLAPYAKEGECELRITARAEDEQAAHALIDPVEARLREKFGPLIYGADVPSLEAAVFRLLQEKGLTFGCAESRSVRGVRRVPGGRGELRHQGEAHRPGGGAGPPGAVRRGQRARGPGHGRGGPAGAGLRHRGGLHRRGRPRPRRAGQPGGAGLPGPGRPRWHLGAQNPAGHGPGAGAPRGRLPRLRPGKAVPERPGDEVNRKQRVFCEMQNTRCFYFARTRQRESPRPVGADIIRPSAPATAGPWGATTRRAVRRGDLWSPVW